MSRKEKLNLDNVRLLLETPTRPIFTLIGNNGETFEVDENSEFVPDDLKKQCRTYMECNKAESKKKIPLKMPKEITTFVTKIKKESAFTTFMPEHTREASQLIEIFKNAKPEELMGVIAYYRDRINPHLFYFALNVALAERTDTRGITGNIVSTFPFKFLNKPTLDAIRKQVNNNGLKEGEVVEEIRRPCSSEPERRVDYFREDIGVNSHHWHWHLVYFNRATMDILRKDRRGELFYYAHQQFLARYDSERMCNGVERVKPIYDFHQVHREGYFSNLQMENSSKDYPGRPDNMVWQDVDRPGMQATIMDLEMYSKRVLNAIDSGCALIADGTSEGEEHAHRFRKLTIDSLGNMVEPSDLSPNRDYYGNLHEFGHIFTGWIHDPKNNHGETDMGVIGDFATAVRDPLFYQWHKYIDNLINKFKTNPKWCPIYTRDELTFNGVTIDNVELEINTSKYKKTTRDNELITHLKNSTVALNGLDFQLDSGRDPIRVKVQHLNHVPYKYKITVTNSGRAKKGTVRIFIAPKFDLCNTQFPISEQRRLFIEMDRFDYDLVNGRNVIERESTKSTVCIPTDKIFVDKVDLRRAGSNTNPDFCTCGWPSHMMLPKGKASGTTYQLFVMISNFSEDTVGERIINEDCSGEAFAYCGLKGQRYPDTKDMGYPFDRSFDNNYTTIEQFIQDEIPRDQITDKNRKAKKIPNMIVKDFTIRFDESFLDE